MDKTFKKEKRGRGRPKKDNSMRKRLDLLLGDDDKNKLDHLAYMNNCSKSEMVRKTIKYYYYKNVE